MRGHGADCSGCVGGVRDSATLAAVSPVRRALCVSVAVLALSIALAAQPGAAVAPPTRVIDPYLGVRYLDHRETVPRPLRLHVTEIDLRAPGIRLKVSPPSGGRETVRETTLDFVRREGRAIRRQRALLPALSVRRRRGLGDRPGRLRGHGLLRLRDARAVVRAGRRRARRSAIDRRNRARIVHRAPATPPAGASASAASCGTPWLGRRRSSPTGVVTVPAYRSAGQPRRPAPAGPERPLRRGPLVVRRRQRAHGDRAVARSPAADPGGRRAQPGQRGPARRRDRTPDGPRLRRVERAQSRWRRVEHHGVARSGHRRVRPAEHLVGQPGRAAGRHQPGGVRTAPAGPAVSATTQAWLRAGSRPPGAPRSRRRRGR